MTNKLTTTPIATAPPVFNPPEFEGALLVAALPEPSTVGLAVGFSAGIDGNDTVGPPAATVSFLGGRGKEAAGGAADPEGTARGGADFEGTEGGVDGNVDGGGTTVEVDGGGTSVEGEGGV